MNFIFCPVKQAIPALLWRFSRIVLHESWKRRCIRRFLSKEYISPHDYRTDFDGKSLEHYFCISMRLCSHSLDIVNEKQLFLTNK